MAAEARLDAGTLSRYLSLPLPPTAGVQLEYVWQGGLTKVDLRCKSRTWSGPAPTNVAQLPIWNFDGSSTGQAPGHDSEVLLKPVAMYADPFRGAPHKLVLCECIDPFGKPVDSNMRAAAAATFAKKPEEEPWFGLEQEYTLFQLDKVTPLGWPKAGFPAPQGPYYCSVGADVAFGRAVAEAHYRACLYAGLKIAGINAEVLPGQWEYQIGPCEGIESGDQCWMARYILQRVCEDFGVTVSFHPKPVRGDWNGSGCHMNYSTRAMREEGGFSVMLGVMDRLRARHTDHMAVYGEDNELRLTGRHETAPMHHFSHGVANRTASVRVPRETEREGKGYFEDRRPASNADPYVITAKLFDTTCLWTPPLDVAV